MVKSTQSLVSMNSLPESLGTAIIPDVAPLHSLTAYVSFVSLKSPAFQKVAPYFPHLKEGEPVLFTPDDAPIRLDPFRFILAHAKAHYSEIDGEGKIVRTSFSRDEAAKDKTLQEHVEAMILVIIGEKLVPARCTFKGTKVKAGWIAISALEIAKEGDKWSKISPDHKASLVVPDPRVRYSTTVTMSFGNVSRSSGHKYTVASGFAKPTTAPDWQLLATFLPREDFRAAADAVFAAWKDRLAEITPK